MPTTMKFEIEFDKPTRGWWDGGAKHGGVFEDDPCHRLDKQHTCFSCWSLNHWFNVKTGRTDKETLSRAKRYITQHCRKPFKFVELK